MNTFSCWFSFFKAHKWPQFFPFPCMKMLDITTGLNLSLTNQPIKTRYNMITRYTFSHCFWYMSLISCANSHFSSVGYQGFLLRIINQKVLKPVLLKNTTKIAINYSFQQITACKLFFLPCNDMINTFLCKFKTLNFIEVATVGTQLNNAYDVVRFFLV